VKHKPADETLLRVAPTQRHRLPLSSGLVSRTLLGLIAAMTALGLFAQPVQAQSCVLTGGSNYTCSGAGTTAQTVNANDAAVTTAPGFSINASSSLGNALSIQGAGNISYIDNNFASLTAGSLGGGMLITSTGDNGATPGAITVQTGGNITGDFGIRAENFGTGALSVTATGQVTGTTGAGISATNYSSEIGRAHV
jgi:hypothetical protein